MELVKPEGNAQRIHCKNFVESIKANDSSMLNCGIKTGSVAAINAHMGNVAYKLGEKIYWDASKEQFTSKKANKMMLADYHNGWKLPKV